MIITHETDVLISLRFLAWKHALKLTHVECIRTKQKGGRKIMALTTAHAAQVAIVFSLLPRCAPLGHGFRVQRGVQGCPTGKKVSNGTKNQCLPNF